MSNAKCTSHFVISLMMDHYKATNLSIFVVTALFLAVTLLACGPADESVKQESGNERHAAQDDDNTEATDTPELACDLTEGDYPNLDDILAKIVSAYETCESTEVEAAAMAPEHSGTRVLIQVEAPAYSLDALDTWMGEKNINPRYVDPEYAWPLVYAYPRVSVLGALSQQDGVTLVRALKSNVPEGVVIHYPKPSLPAVKAEDDTDLPELPGWLKGYRHPRTYHEYDGGWIRNLMERYDKGEVTDESISKRDFVIGCGVNDDKRVSVGLRVKDTDEALQTVREWLAERDIHEDASHDERPGIKVLLVYMRPSEIKAVSELADVARAYIGYECPAR